MKHETNLPQAVRDFMRAGEQTVDGFNATQATLYTGLQLEEMAEKLQAISTGCLTAAERTYLTDFASALMELSGEFKSGRHRGDIMRADREKLLDADIDLAWVSVGAAYSTSSNTSGAMGEVVRSNLDKVPGGVCRKDATGKIIKPFGWKGPNLSPFVAISDD